MFLERALATGRRRLPQRGLLRTLVLRTLIVCLVPLGIVAAACLILSRSLMESRFQQEAELVAATAEQDISEQAANTTRAASLLAELPSTRQLMERQDPEALTSYLLPLKSRLGVDLMNVATTDGRTIAGAQDIRVGSTIPDSLIARGLVTADKAWEILDEGTDVVLRAIAPIRGADGAQLGIIEVGVLLNNEFLTASKGSSSAELAIVWGTSTKATTIDTGDARLPTVAEVDDTPDDKIVRNVALPSGNYLGVFRLLHSHGRSVGTIAVLTPRAPLEHMEHTLLAVLGGLLLALAAVIVGLSYRLATRMTGPLQRLCLIVERIRSGDFQARVRPDSDDEIGTLQVAFNEMASSLAERDSERSQYEARLEYMASHDSVTRLPNRHALEEALRDTVAGPASKDTALLYVDLDQFKLVNDTLGHPAGDRLLANIASLLRAHFDDEHLVARLGGDEFAILLRGVDEDRALTMAERLRVAVEASRFLDLGQTLRVSVSVGIAFVDTALSSSEALAHADVACYAAKGDGRNRVALYQPDGDTLSVLSNDAHWAAAATDAIREDRIVVLLQPIVDLGDRAVNHYEALVRIRDADGTLVTAAQFIPAAERSGLIETIDRRVLREVAIQIGAARRVGVALEVAVNLSPYTLASHDFVAFVVACLNEQSVPPRQLTFELTETALMTNLSKVRASMLELSSMGCQFSLDDFGSGFSSFKYLAELPVDQIKIDGAFVVDLATSEPHREMVRAMATVAGAMGQRTIAECVEDEQTALILSALGVDFGQGFHFGAPDYFDASAHRVRAA